jgi:hypothetical protein
MQKLDMNTVAQGIKRDFNDVRTEFALFIDKPFKNRSQPFCRIFSRSGNHTLSGGFGKPQKLKAGFERHCKERPDVL